MISLRVAALTAVKTAVSFVMLTACSASVDKCKTLWRVFRHALLVFAVLFSLSSPARAFEIYSNYTWIEVQYNQWYCSIGAAPYQPGPPLLVYAPVASETDCATLAQSTWNNAAPGNGLFLTLGVLECYDFPMYRRCGADLYNWGTLIPGAAVIYYPVNTVISIQPTLPLIPYGSGVQNDHVLTRSDLTLQVTKDGQPASDVSVSLQSDRGTQDTITGPANPTDANGIAIAEVETRAQPGTSTITSASADTQTAQPGVIQWLPAHYQGSFLLTCYILSLESNFPNQSLVNTPGMPNNPFPQGFLSEVKMNGSGFTLDGKYIRYNSDTKKYEFSKPQCPVTSTGACAVDGTSAAVDGHVIPQRSTFSVETIGPRVAQDVGGKIKGYHIDVYFGTRRTDCYSAGRQYYDVDLLHY